VESAAPPQPHPDVTVEELAHRDLLGRMLRKSFSREPHRRLYWPTRRALVRGLLTAGAWPALVLLWRLSRYADHQRYRGRMLLDWVRVNMRQESPAARNADPSEIPPLKLINRVRPVALMYLAGLCYLAAVVGLMIAMARPSFFDRLHFGGVSGLFILLPAAWVAMMIGSLLHGLAIIVLHWRFARFAAGLGEYGFTLRPRAFEPPRVAPAAAVLLAALPLIAAPLLYFLWPVGAAVGFAIGPLLAAEQQRGYITHADSRLRYAIARRIGAELYAAPRSTRTEPAPE
jgi:hypothetical protein